MSKFSVIVPLTDTGEYLDKALDSLIHQTDDNFEVIIVDAGSTDNSAEIAQKYVENYVDFFYLKADENTRHAAFNRGIQAAVGEYILFYDPDGYITDETIEELNNTITDDKPDMITFRMWKYGDNRYSDFDSAGDVLAILPDIDKGEKTMLSNLDISNKAFRRAIIEANRLSFDENPHSDGLFVMNFVMNSRKIVGCPRAVYERRLYTYASGFDEMNIPTKENLEFRLSAWDSIYELVYDYLENQSGSVDGDESLISEVNNCIILDIVNRFYRYFWHFDAEFLTFFVEKYNEYANRLSQEKINALRDKYKHLYLPYVFDNHEIAAEKPIYSFILDIAKQEEIKDVIESFYVQTMPFFEIFVKQSDFACEYFPERLKSSANLHVLADKDFYSNARKKAKSKICINVRDGRYLDENVIKETFTAVAPSMMKPWVFANKRNSLSVKKNLKDKGLNI